MTLLTKFFFTFVSTIPIIFIIFLTYTVQTTYRDQMNALKLHATISTDLQASALKNPVWNLNEESIDEIIHALKSDSSYISSTLTLVEGSSKLGESKFTFEKEPGAKINPDRILEFESPVMLKDEKLGVLKNQFSTQKIIQNYSFNIIQGIVELITLLSLIAIILYYTLRFLIINPVNSLIGTMELVCSGDLSAKTKINTHDEMGKMAENFEKMKFFLTNTLAQLNVSKEELKEYANNLEETVAKRTEDLQLTNDTLKESLNALKIAQTDLLAAKDAATQANITKSQFLANMSHELRTPLNAIIGYSEMIGEECLEKGLVGFSEDLEKINMSGKHLLSLINDILDLSKIEAGKMTIFLENTSPLSVISDVKTIALPLVAKKNNKFELKYTQELESIIMHTDVIKLRQCILNLIGNASKFTENGEICLEIDVCEHEGIKMMKFAIHDTGIGIKPEQLERLFKSFSQVDSETTRKYGGTGLGLYLTQRFCNMLGGYVTVDSTLDKGSTFTIFLPINSDFILTQSKHTKTSEETLIHAVNVTSSETLSQGTVAPPTILVIDDDVLFLDSLDQNLGHLFHFLRANSSEDGLNLAKKYSPDAIIISLSSPTLGGWNLLQDLKADEDLEDIPVILMAFDKDQNKGYTFGSTDFLEKPINPLRLQEILTKQIRDRPAHVLVVDDDLGTREYLHHLLKKGGWQVGLASNGREALDSLAHSMPSVMLLDLMMPEMNGFQVVEELRHNKQWSGLPVIIVTSKDLTAQERAILNGGVDLILKKGAYLKEELLQEIKKQIEYFIDKRKQSFESLAVPLIKVTDITEKYEIKGKKVLVIDDEQFVHVEISDILVKEGYLLFHAFNGLEGIAVASKNLPDLIILDVVMPGIDGWQVLTQLKDNPNLRDIPVIMLTKSPDEKIAFSRGVHDIFLKPIPSELLIDKVKKYTAPNKGQYILIVDDDETSRSLVNKILSKAGWNVEEADCGKMALEKVKLRHPALIVLDIMMPEMNGFEVIEKLQEDPETNKIPVILLSARSLTNEEKKTLNKSVVHYFQKGSYLKAELLTEVRLQLIK